MLVAVTVPDGACVCVNGAFVRVGGVTVPVTGDTVFSVYPPGRSPKWCRVFPVKDGLRAAPGDGCLVRRADAYTLSFPSDAPSPPPPVAYKEKAWRGGSLALCGGALIHETKDERLLSFPGVWEDYRVLSDSAVLVQAPGRAAVVGAELKALLGPIDAVSVRVAGGRLELKESVPGFDCFTVRRVCSVSPFSLLDTSLLRLPDAPIVPCFAQAVRLGAVREAALFMSPALQKEMTVEDVAGFLGPFDRCEKTDDGRPDALALRYCLDPWNYRYMCYAFTLDPSTSSVDDIEQYI